MTPDQIESIKDLRSRNVGPKQIARKLGLRPAEVKAMIKQQAEQGEIQRELPAFRASLVNSHAAQLLLQKKKLNLESDGVGGMAQIMLLRVDEREHHWVSSYMVDYWCLGVKNTFGPRQVSRRQYDEMLWTTEERFGQAFQEITLAETQAIVYGAVDYAAGLGIEPHADFRRSRSHLGPRPDNLMKIEFGRNGQPYFIAGPYDRPEKILPRLQASVGEGNFRYLQGPRAMPSLMQSEGH